MVFPRGSIASGHTVQLVAVKSVPLGPPYVTTGSGVGSSGCPARYAAVGPKFLPVTMNHWPPTVSMSVAGELSPSCTTPVIAKSFVSLTYTVTVAVSNSAVASVESSTLTTSTRTRTSS